jgi:putative heme iron utilization protein
MYQKINKEIDKKIQTIIEGNYEVSVLGTIGEEGYPFLSKILPMFDNSKIYILISDLSEHTQNIKLNDKVSFYFSMKEINNTKLNNPRLTLSGSISKLELNKNSSQYIDLLKNYQKIEKGSKMCP